MLAAIKKQFQVRWEDGFGSLLLILAGAILGFIFVQIILRVIPDEKNYVALGTIMSGVMAVFFSGAVIITSTGTYFNMEIAMGCTRKQFFVSNFIVNFVFCLISFAVLIPICLAENALCAVMHPKLENAMNFMPYLLKWSLPAAVALAVFCMLCAAFLLRFGKAATGTLWVLWLVLCIGGPKILDAMEDAPNSVFGRLGNGLASIAAAVPANIWIVCGIAAAIVGTAGSYLLLRRQQVVS